MEENRFWNRTVQWTVWSSHFFWSKKKLLMAGDPICDLPSSLESAIVSWQKLVPGEIYQGKHKWPVSSKWPGLIPQNGCHLTLERSRKTPKWVTRKNLGGRNVVIFWWDETSWNVMWKTNGDLFPSFFARWWAKGGVLHLSTEPRPNVFPRDTTSNL